MLIPFRAHAASFQIAGAENASLLALLVAAQAGSNRMRLLIDRILCPNTLIAAGTGVGIQLSIRRIKALTSGTAGVVLLLDPSDQGHLPPLANLLTCATLGTATAATPAVTLHHAVVNNDEVPATGRIEPERPLWTPARPDCPLVVGPGSGIDILHVTNSTVGRFFPVIEGRISWG